MLVKPNAKIIRNVDIHAFRTVKSLLEPTCSEYYLTIKNAFICLFRLTDATIMINQM